MEHTIKSVEEVKGVARGNTVSISLLCKYDPYDPHPALLLSLPCYYPCHEPTPAMLLLLPLPASIPVLILLLPCYYSCLAINPALLLILHCFYPYLAL